MTDLIAVVVGSVVASIILGAALAGIAIVW
jgi:hypothetical protein